MKCFSPISIKDQKDAKTIPVPCGRCLACKRRRALHWSFRLQQEHRNSTSAAFITLTYRDTQLPGTPNGFPTLHYPDVQRFLKRLRKQCGYTQKHYEGCVYGKKQSLLKYFLCGEYGKKDGRPHYHMIAFNIPNILLTTDKNEPYRRMKEIWSHGLVDIREVNENRIHYVTGYTLKTTTNTEHPDDDRKKERAWMSQGLGECYITPAIRRYYSDSLDNLIRTPGGGNIGMPRYYKNKLFTDEQRKIVDRKTQLFIENLDEPDLHAEHEAKKAQILNQQRKRTRKDLESQL